MENLSLSELRTIQFYEFDYRLRGYYLFPYPVDIQPPYLQPFPPLTAKSYIDDGRVPSIFKQIGNLLLPPKQVEQQEETTLQPIPISSVSELIGFSFSFPKRQEISAFISIEFINQLSFTETPISFEIIGTSEIITFQIVCDDGDINIIKSQLKAFFPTCNIQDILVFDLGFDLQRNVGIVDFGLCNESMLPIKSADNYSFDPLTSFIATLDSLQTGDIAMLQIIMKGVTAPFSYGMNVAVSDGQGGSFFADFPDLHNQCKEKTAYPLFASVIRIATQSKNDHQTNNLAQELIRNISTISSNQNNSLIPLSNKGYDYENGHLKNVYYRQSHRLGMILSSKELATFFHFPNRSIVSNKLHPQTGNTKVVKREYTSNKYVLGFNEHNGITETVSISENTFSRHLLLAGSTGSGKTHALKLLLQQSIQEPNVTTVVIDGHGDLAQDLLLNIKEQDKKNVVFLNIADEEFSFGFNIFSVETETEKGVLASDLQKVFQATFISSGDRINSVLQKTISTFLYSKKEASILDMKRFLLEKDFRTEFIEALDDDPILEYYWVNEFPLVKRHELSPLLLRIDSYLQTRLLRNFFALRKGIDFKDLIEQKKTIIIQLSVGLIGLENSKFIADLFVTKITQIAFSRASLPQQERHPIKLFVDESHYYANSENIEHILSGARKFSLNLVCAFQHLDQVENHTLNSFLTNTGTQIYFRQNDKDARRIASNFSHFEAEDFMELGLGEALVKIDKRSNDFNLMTFPLEIYNEPQQAEEIRQYIIQNSRQKYATSITEVSELIKEYLPQNTVKTSLPKQHLKEIIVEPKKQDDDENRITTLKTNFKREKITTDNTSNFEQQKEVFLQQAEEQEQIRKHRASQNYVRTMALQRGFKVTFEQKTSNGGRVDVALLKNDIRIAIEISVTNTVEYEVQNIEKCIADNFSLAYMISDDIQHLQNIKKLALKLISKKHHSKIHFFASEELPLYLDATEPKIKTSEKRIRGYRVKVNYKADDITDNKQKSITDIVMKALRQK